LRQLLTLGVTGGIVPCPAALVVLLSAVDLQRIGVGLLRIVAFSASLAVALIAISLVRVYTRRFMSRFQGEGSLIARWLPLTSAALITVFGAVMIGQALISARILTFHL
jgi:ABC-type nickel/cobalt efflux system permease component RcnA